MPRSELFTNDDSARAYLEGVRWRYGMYCPHCGSRTGAYKIEARADSRRPARKGLYKCKECRKQFTVTVGSIFEDSHIKLHVWLQAIHLLCASKKGMSAHQLHRMLGVTYKSAWFMAHRIRYAMTQQIFTTKLTGTVEADETFVGGYKRGAQGGQGKVPVLTILERGGTSRSKITKVAGLGVSQAVEANVDQSARIITDDHPSYRKIRNSFADYHTVKHRLGEYARGSVHTNTVEGFFSLLKRGIFGIYHHVSPQHLDRYLAEFDFRYSSRKMDDNLRTRFALAQANGKRLTYKDCRRHIIAKAKAQATSGETVSDSDSV